MPSRSESLDAEGMWNAAPEGHEPVSGIPGRRAVLASTMFQRNAEDPRRGAQNEALFGSGAIRVPHLTLVADIVRDVVVRCPAHESLLAESVRITRPGGRSLRPSKVVGRFTGGVGDQNRQGTETRILCSKARQQGASYACSWECYDCRIDGGWAPWP